MYARKCQFIEIRNFQFHAIIIRNLQFFLFPSSDNSNLSTRELTSL
ncbi:hypothetical protein MED222_05870 [Vibrio sp. MED222]|nr:hypothetical protein MED222_05870 [Vibrio sp. MED222]